jgi:regulator of protease activity HflC (stomatin/prohibitin superfamily)
MAVISSLLFVRHVRGEPTAQLLFFRKGHLVESGRGLAFWFTPLGASLAEVPLDDREVPLIFHARSLDFQELTVQGVVTYRVAMPDILAERVDFAIDERTGVHKRQPLEKIALAVTELAQQLARSELGTAPLREALERGPDLLRDIVHQGLARDASLAALGLEIVATRISSVTPTSEMEKALQMPTREKIQQQADEATFARRALAVEKERAIQENELESQVELARREQLLIDQRGANEQRRAEEAAAAKRIEIGADAEATRTRAEAEAERIRRVEEAKVNAERERMAIYKDLPQPALFGLAARDLAGHLPAIGHLSIGSDTLGPVLARLAQAGAAELERPKGKS